jgi:hypothetical protein
MRIFGDHGKVADLRLAIDPAQHPRLPCDSRTSVDSTVRAVHLGRVVNPTLAVLRQRKFALDVPAEIAAPDITEIPERPNSIHRPISCLQGIVSQQFVFLCHGRLLQLKAPRRNPAADDCGQHDVDIDLRFLIESGHDTAGSQYTHGRDALDPANQAVHHASQQLIQRTLRISFTTTMTIQPMPDHVLKNS